MRFQIDSDRARTLITSTPGEFDAVPPVPTLEVSFGAGAKPCADRWAVGLSLIYSPWLAGPVQMPMPVSALTGQRLTEFFGDRYVTVVNVEDRALPLPAAWGQAQVVDLVRDPEPAPSQDAIVLAPFSLREGHRSSGRSLTVASNVHLFSGAHAVTPDAHLLGLAVIAADLVDAGTLVRPTADVRDPHLLHLLEAVSLGLSDV